LKVGDRVRLAEHVAARLAARARGRTPKHGEVNCWFTREGTIAKKGGAKSVNSDLYGVLWDGRRSLDWWNSVALELRRPKFPRAFTQSSRRSASGGA